MKFSLRSVEYFYTRVEDEPGRAYGLLANLASEDINVLAFSAVPYGPNYVELTIFPDAGHGGIFQYHREFTEQALRFFGS